LGVSTDLTLKKQCWRILKTTKILFSFLIGALLIAGLFLFFRPGNHDNSSTSLKPSQLNFSESNQLSSSSPKHDTPSIAAPASETKSPSLHDNFSAQEKSQWATFEDILKTKNDNDPRLDQDLKKISSRFREALYEKYAQLPPEDHSRRGLVAYLIARNGSSIEDMQFLKKIFQEPPCLSMADCKSAPVNQDPHHTSVDQTTLVYEQLSVLYLLERQISQNPSLLNDAASRSGFIQVLAQAESYPVPTVHEKARALRAKYGL